MEYTVSDIAELFDEGEIDPLKIKRISKVWGEYVGDVWVGGICFKSRTGDHYRVHRRSTSEVRIEESEGHLPPLSADYDDTPTEVVEWLRAGGRLEDSYEY